jgi:hypothetical protein
LRHKDRGRDADTDTAKKERPTRIVSHLFLSFALSCNDWRTAITHFTAALTLLDPHLKSISQQKQSSLASSSALSSSSSLWVIELAVQIYCKRAVAHLNAGNARRSLIDTSVALKLIQENTRKTGTKGGDISSSSPSSSFGLSELMSLLTRGSAQAALKDWAEAERDLSRGLDINQRYPRLASLPIDSLIEIRSARLAATLNLIVNSKESQGKSVPISVPVPSAAELRHLQGKVLDSASGGVREDRDRDRDRHRDRDRDRETERQRSERNIAIIPFFSVLFVSFLFFLLPYFSCFSTSPT